jgi:anaerobic selenocysteine-containing dehydrogenase
MFPAGSISIAHLSHVFKAVVTGEPYPVKAVICQANNPMITFPDVNTTYQGLKSENLELSVVMDYFMTPTAQLADYVLPAADTLERNDLTDPYYGFAPFVTFSPKVIEPLCERKTDYHFWKELGRRVGQEEYWPWDTIEDTLDYRLEPLGLTFEQAKQQDGIGCRPTLKKYEKYQGFPTPSGKVELYSTIFEKLGYDPLPEFKEPPQSPIGSPELAEKYPLILVTGDRFNPMHHSEFFQMERARKKYSDPLVHLNPETAASLGIKDRDWVVVENPTGKIRMKAKLSTDIHPKMAHVQHGWWFPEREGAEPELFGVFESNANLLCPNESQYNGPETGSWPHTALLCNVKPAKD